jgi:hypothetical protein
METVFSLHIPTVLEETEELLDSREELCSTYVVSTEGLLLWEREDDGDTDDADSVDDDDGISIVLLRPPAQCTTKLT